MAAIQPNMDFMVEESYNKHAKDHSKKMQKKNHCCCHCNKNISRVQNLKFHQETCEKNENRLAYRRFYGVDPDVFNGGFKLIESALKKMFILYRKN